MRICSNNKRERSTPYENISKRTNISQPGTILIPAGPRLGDEIITAKGLSKSIIDGAGNRRQLFKDVSFKVDAGAIIGIVGPNGVGMFPQLMSEFLIYLGKTTLLKVLAGEETIDDGNLVIGSTVKFGYASQSRQSLKDYNTVYEEVAEG